MAEKLPIAELSRQPLVRGTSCFTNPAGDVGFKSEDIQLSALVRIADALEAPARAKGRLDLRQLLLSYDQQLAADEAQLRHQNETLPLPHPPADQSPSFFAGAAIVDQLEEVVSQRQLVAAWLQQLAARPLPAYTNLRRMARAWGSEQHRKGGQPHG